MCECCFYSFCCFFFKQKTAYEMRISDWSSDVCSSDLTQRFGPAAVVPGDAGGVDQLHHQAVIVIEGLDADAEAVFPAQEWSGSCFFIHCRGPRGDCRHVASPLLRNCCDGRRAALCCVP